MAGYRVVEYGYRTRNQMFLLWILLFSSDVSCCGISPVLSANAPIAGALLGVKTLRTQDTSDPRHFGTIRLVPNCLDR